MLLFNYRAKEVDERTELEIKSSFKFGMLKNNQNEYTDRTSRSIQRRSASIQRSAESSQKASELENLLRQINKSKAERKAKLEEEKIIKAQVDSLKSHLPKRTRGQQVTHGEASSSSGRVKTRGGGSSVRQQPYPPGMSII